MRQQIFDLAGLVRGQPGQDVLEVGIRVVPVHARRLDQAHDGGCALARAQRASKEPIGPTLGNDPFIVHLFVKCLKTLRSGSH